MPMIDPRRLRKLRGGMSRKKLADRARVSERTIQRIESDPGRSRPIREHTLDQLAKALDVDIGVLTGELPLPESDKAEAPDAGRVQIGAQIPPKARLAYDLVKRRYGVSMTEIIGVAPLFFVLLAEGSLKRRREKHREASDTVHRLDEIWSESVHGTDGGGVQVSLNALDAEEESIEKADIFGRLYVEGDYPWFLPPAQDDNPFAAYLRELSKSLNKHGAVDVGDLRYGSPSRFPDYDLWNNEIDRMANGSPDARRTLELGVARLSDIPDELMGEDSSEKRAAWLEEKLPDAFRDLEEGSPEAVAAQIVAASAPGEMKKAMKEELSRTTTRKGVDR